MKKIIVLVLLVLLIFTAFGCNRGGDREGRRVRGTVINAEEALKLSEEYDMPYLLSDFKKKEGYKRSIELSHEYNLYRQNYCGCVYSR